MIQIQCFLGISAFADTDAAAENKLRVGYYANSFPDFSLADIQISVKLFAEELGESMGIPVNVMAYADIDRMSNDFSQGKLDYVGGSSLILATKFDTGLFADGFSLIRKGDYTNSLIVLAQKQAGKIELKDLRGKRLVLAETDPLVDLYIDYLSRSVFKQSYKNVFKVMPREKKAHQVILKLFFGKADLICVHNYSYKLAIDLNPQIQDSLQVVARLDNIREGTGFFHKNTEPEFREYVIKKVMDLPNTARGRQFLEIFKSDGVVRSGMPDLLPAKKLFDTNQQLINRDIH
ncbi:MAG: PhnD/SsuA/transferrin family substrate-binding protein [Methylomonas sp.]|nr:PhnD/SsuA/transferrin family substrate-binding protein [Methylomonas sp.]